MANRNCSEPDCDRPHYARGWCKRCYLRAWTRGEHITQPRSLVEVGATHEERLRNIGWTVTADGCWEWAGSRNGRGYGQVAVGNYDGRISRSGLAHRISYEVFKGEIGDGLSVLHRCDNPPCINPEHLFLGTRATNNADTAAKLRNQAGELHHRARLLDAQVVDIRSRYAGGGVNQRTLAAEYGVSQQLISLLTRDERRTSQTRPGVGRQSSI